MRALDNDNVVKVTLTEDFVTKAFIEQGGVSFWGNGGFKIKAIGTTKESVLNTTGISATLMNNERVNSEIYDLLGRKVSQPTKGLYIVNGKKVIIR